MLKQKVAEANQRLQQMNMNHPTQKTNTPHPNNKNKNKEPKKIHYPKKI